MGFPKVSTFIIGMIWIGFIATVFSLYIANLTDNYDVQFDESQIDTLNKLEELNEKVEIYQASSDIQEPSDLQDRLGGYFSQAYQAVRTIADSFDIFKDLVWNALDNDNLNFVAAEQLKMAILSTVIVFLFIGVLLSAIVKREL